MNCLEILRILQLKYMRKFVSFKLQREKIYLKKMFEF